MSKKSKEKARLRRVRAERERRELEEQKDTVVNLAHFLRNKKSETDKVKVYIVEGPGVYSVLQYKRWVVKDPFMEEASNPENADVLLFTGGVDIGPSIYHQPSHRRTNAPNPNRDRYEMAMFCMGLDKLKVGICRGAQLLNVLSGGNMIQHVEGHTSAHSIKLLTENDAIMHGIPSTHHQMMLPSPNVADRTIIGVAWNPLKKEPRMCNPDRKYLPEVMEKERHNFLRRYCVSDFNPYTQDLEIVYYNNTNSLCIQSHPEKPTCPGAFNAYCANLTVKLAKQTTKTREAVARKNGDIICVDT